MKKIKLLFKKKTVRNSAWIIAERIYQMVINFVLTIMVSRYLGPANYGVLNYGATLVNIFLVFTKLGLDTMITNEFIKHRNKEGEMLGTSVTMRLISAMISIGIIAILVFVLQANSPIIIITSIIQSLALLFQVIYIFDYWFQSYFKSKYVSIAKVIAYTVMTGYKIWLLLSGKGVIWFAAASVIDALVVAILLMIFYKKNHGQKIVTNFSLGKNLLKRSYHFIISGVMVLIYTQIDKIMIGQMLDEYQLGLYSAALSICLLIGFIPDAILTSARTSVFSAKQDNKQYLKKLKQTYALVFWVCAGMAFVISVAAPLIVNIIYGDQYVGAISTLSLLVWYIPLSYLGTARAIWIVTENKNKYSKYYTFWGVLMNVGLNAFMIPLWGIFGATIATIITELFTLFITPLFYKETKIHTKYVLEAIVFNFKEEDE
jgi:O-antigen/teichoic acid export membrane protein